MFHGVLTYIYNGVLKTEEEVATLLRGSQWRPSDSMYMYPYLIGNGSAPVPPDAGEVVADADGWRYRLSPMLADVRKVWAYREDADVIWRDGPDGVRLVASGTSQGDDDEVGSTAWAEAFWALDAILLVGASDDGGDVTLLDWAGFC